MTTLESRCLDAFPEWLRTLPHDTQVLMRLLEEPRSAGWRPAATALAYLRKSIDLIPNGLEDLGFIDDACILRVAASRARVGNPSEALTRLAEQAELIREFLGPEYSRLERVLEDLESRFSGAYDRGDEARNSELEGELLSELSRWAETYEPPLLARDPLNLIKLRSFLKARIAHALEGESSVPNSEGQPPPID